MVTTRARSKRTVKKEFTSITGVILTDNYCRRCRENLPPRQFYQATDLELDTGGIMSVCKPCCAELYDGMILTERTLDKTLLRMCRLLNIVYDESVVDSVRKEMVTAQSSTRKPKHPFAIYRSRVSTMLARGSKIEKDTNFDLTFFEPRGLQPSEESLELMSHDKFWGESYKFEEVEFLENEYSNFKRNYTTDDHATVVLLKMACKKLLAIKQVEDEGSKKGTGTLEKELMTLMKELAISPAHSNAASSGKMADIFGLWVKEIEKFTPAEWMENEAKDLHHDVDNVALYYENYVKRPIRNFMTGNADYSILDEEGNITDDGV